MQVGIQTTQNVEISYEVASIGDRILAAIIDYLVIAGYIIGCLFFYGFLVLVASGFFTDSTTVTVTIAIFAAPIFFYDLLFEIFMHGQSIGKRQRQIKVVKLDGTQPDIGSYLLRWLVRMVEASLFLGGGAIAITAILLNGKGQRLGDMAAGTTVVKVRQRVTLEDTIFSAVEENYTPLFPQVTRLNDNDALIIREALTAEEHGHDGVAAALLYARAKELLGIHTDMAPVPFLRTLLKDYNYYAGR